MTEIRIRPDSDVFKPLLSLFGKSLGEKAPLCSVISVFLDGMMQGGIDTDQHTSVYLTERVECKDVKTLLELLLQEGICLTG